jgi:hypothetical protein
MKKVFTYIAAFTIGMTILLFFLGFPLVILVSFFSIYKGFFLVLITLIQLFLIINYWSLLFLTAMLWLYKKCVVFHDLIRNNKKKVNLE